MISKREKGGKDNSSNIPKYLTLGKIYLARALRAIPSVLNYALGSNDETRG